MIYTDIQPTKLSGNNGVEFVGAENIVWPNDAGRCFGVRGALTVFRVDFASLL